MKYSLNTENRFPELNLTTPNFAQFTQKEQQQPLCKFCYLSQSESSQKLISPCGCSGTLKFVHKDCLKKWITTQADREDAPLAPSYRLEGLSSQCKICLKNIVFEDELYKIEPFWIFQSIICLLYYIKKLKYYACISIVGSLAINYYFFRFFAKQIGSISKKIKKYSTVFLIILSLFFVLLGKTFIQVKWNSSNLQFSIPYLIDQ